MAREQVKKHAPKPGAGPTAISGVIVKDGVVVENDPWVFLADGDDGPEEGAIVVSLTRFKAEREALLKRNDLRLGVLIAPGEEIEDVAEDIHRFELIAVAFPAFRDGRGFSTARLARERYGFKGELRAAGDVIPDLIFFMLRCGFNSFTLRGADPIADYERAAKSFSISYQAAADGRRPVYGLRAARAEKA
ncbi:MAG: DUF934 domain-containing protein [Caulobacterales bacterium]